MEILEADGEARKANNFGEVRLLETDVAKHVRNKSDFFVSEDGRSDIGFQMTQGPEKPQKGPCSEERP